MRIWKKSIGIGVILGLVAVGITVAQSHLISGERIKAHVRFLSSDLLEGRGVGTRGGQLAEEYLAAQLAVFGAKPAGENGTYFQRVPLVGVETSPVLGTICHPRMVKPSTSSGRTTTWGRLIDSSQR